MYAIWGCIFENTLELSNSSSKEDKESVHQTTQGKSTKALDAESMRGGEGNEDKDNKSAHNDILSVAKN